MINEFKFMVKEIVDYRELFYYLTMKEIKIKYKQSIIGVGWAIFTALRVVIIFGLIFRKSAQV
jgi:ABC-type polysaccharide/polyol phosphate export permease